MSSSEPVWPSTKYLSEEDFLAGEETVFDRIDPDERDRAIREAESTLELDVNGGEAIDVDSTPLAEDHYSQAASLFAAYVLTRSARHPQSNTRAAMSDNDMDTYQDRLLKDYTRKIERINAADGDAIENEPGEVDEDGNQTQPRPLYFRTG